MSKKNPQAKAARSEAKPAKKTRKPSPAHAAKKKRHGVVRRVRPSQGTPLAKVATIGKPAAGIPGRKEVEWHALFISALHDVPFVTHACVKANVTRTTAYVHKADDPQFSAEWDAAIKSGMDRLPDVLEATAYDRAVNGVTRRKYDKDGNLLDEWQEHSDVLLKTLLSGNAPAKFGDKLDLTGTEKFVPLDELRRRVREGKKS